MPGHCWHDCKWIFGNPLFQYDSQRFHLLLHNRHKIIHVLNLGWVCNDVEKMLIKILHNLCLNYDLKSLGVCMDTDLPRASYQGMTWKARESHYRVRPWNLEV